MFGIFEVRSGSIASFWSSANYFRSSPGSGHHHDRSACLKSANGGSNSGFRINPSAWADEATIKSLSQE